MRAAAFVLAVTAALAAPALAQTSTRAYLCEGAALAANGEEVDVFLVRSGDNGFSSSNALWFPALVNESGPSGSEIPDVVLSINYDNSAPGRIGSVRNMTTVAAVTAPLRGNVAHSALERRLAGYRIDYSFDGSAPKVLTMEQLGEDKTPPGSAASQADLGQPIPLPGWVELRMMQGKKDAPIVRRFALSSTASRDTLFAKAWAEAEAKFASPAGKCEPIG